MKTHEDVFDPDDVRLSAYALGELEGEEQAEVERLIASDPCAAAFVDELRSTAGAVEREFAAEVFVASEARSSVSSVARRMTAEKALGRRRLLQAAGITLLLGSAAFLAQMTRSTDDVSELAQRSDRATNEVPAGGEIVEENLAVNPSAASTPAPYGSPEWKRPPIQTGAEFLDEEGNAAIGVGAKGVSGAPAPFASRRMGGGVSKSSHAGKAVKGRSSAASKPAAGVYYDDGKDGDFRATTKDVFEKDLGSEGYNAIVENAFKLVSQDPLSTFSIDVDTASYSNVRRFLNEGRLPPPDAVRIEELVNYFRYAYPAPEGDVPFSNTATVASCPWAPAHKLVQVGLRARDVDLSRRQPSNLVFLIDVSGSMDEPDKLPLLQRSMRMLVEQLDGRDRIAIVVYAGASGLVLPSTSCDSKAYILNALDALDAGGSTNGGAGIELAYAIANESKISEGQNRVILCTDGDFNVGVTDQGALVRLIEEKRKSGVFLSVLGFGTGNVKDSTMEMLADKGNGNYSYIDSLAEARKVLVSEMGGTLFTVAKDVKIQVEFNPARVQAWRLIGYENRMLAHEDFNDDKKDAGEIGAGHNVTALYEIVPVGVSFAERVDPLKYQLKPWPSPPAAAYSDELLTLKLRYKAPDGDTSQLLSTPVKDTNAHWSEASEDFRFAASVAAFGMVLRKSVNVGTFTLNDVLNLALPSIGPDPERYRREYITLVRRAQSLSGEKPSVR